MSQTETATATYSAVYLPQLVFTDISLTETDTVPSYAPSVGYDVSTLLNDPYNTATSFGAYTFGSSPTYEGFAWADFGAGVYGDPNGGVVSQTLTFTYNVAAATGNVIMAFDPLVVYDELSGPSSQLSLTAVETVTSGGTLVGTSTWTPSGSTGTTLSAPVSSASVTLTVTAAINAPVEANSPYVNDEVHFSTIAQGFVAAGVSIDKQISVDGGQTWVDVGNGTLNDPQALAGSTVEYRAIVTNTSSAGVSLNNVQVTDANGPSPFTVDGQSTFSLAAGASVTTDIMTATAVSGYQEDTATVTATANDGMGTATVTGSDTADYTGVAASVSIDDQVSLDGNTWYDVGSAVFNNPTTLVGGTIYERAIITDTGATALSNVSIGDAGTGSAASVFTVGGAATTTLAVGQTVTSDVMTTTALAGYQLNTATVTGIATLNGATVSVSATDTADATGVTAGVSIDDQVSLNGTTWYDVGSAVFNNPTTLVGGTIYERAIITDTGTTALSNVSISDTGAGSAASVFTVGGAASTTLAVGQTVTSDVMTTTALAGYQLNTATVTGTVTLTDGAPTNVSGTVTATDTADATGVTAGVSIDDQVSLNGTTWYDVGSAVFNNPTTLVGGTIYERAIITDTGTTALSNVSISDTGAGSAASVFTVGGAASTTLAVGQTVTSDVMTTTALAGHEFNTATVTGTVTLTGGAPTNVSGTVTATDTADATGVTAGVSIDDQVSLNGTTWYDFGSAVFNNPTTLVGGTIYERAIITDTGTTALSNVSISDTGAGSAASVFTVGGAASTTLAVGQTVTSDVMTTTALAGHEFNTATVTGTVTLTGGSPNNVSGTVSATDTADATGVTAGVSIDDQVSLNGTTWYDVGSTVFNNPTTLVGGTIYERAIITDTGTTALSNVSIGDTGVGSAASVFTVGGAATTTLAVGQTVTSDVMTTTALAGHEFNTATVTGTVTLTGGSPNNVSGTVTAVDTADDTGVTTGISIDDQVSLNGTTWYDVGSAVFNNPTTLVGGTIYERAIITDTGTTALSNVSIGDSGSGAPSFTFSGSATTALAVGQTETSDVVTTTAAAGHQYNTATVTGTVTLTGSAPTNVSGTVSAGDTVDYTGLVANGAISVTVYNDANDDGKLDNGETGDAGITVSLLNANGVATGVTAVTNSAGVVNFTNLAPGTYEVSLPTPAGDVVTQSTNMNTPLTVTSGGTVSAEEGLFKPGAIVITVYNDANDDGKFDNGDTGDAGITVSLLNASGVATGITAVTNSSGTAEFSNLVAGTYEVAVATPTGDVVTQTISINSALAVTAGGTVYAQEGLYKPNGSISIDKQVSVNGGATWEDVGKGVLQDPSIAAGATVEYRAIVTNTGSTALNDVSINDVGNGAPTFTFASTSTFELLLRLRSVTVRQRLRPVARWRQHLVGIEHQSRGRPDGDDKCGRHGGARRPPDRHGDRHRRDQRHLDRCLQQRRGRLHRPAIWHQHRQTDFGGWRQYLGGCRQRCHAEPQHHGGWHGRLSRHHCQHRLDRPHGCVGAGCRQRCAHLHVRRFVVVVDDKLLRDNAGRLLAAHSLVRLQHGADLQLLRVDEFLACHERQSGGGPDADLQRGWHCRACRRPDRHGDRHRCRQRHIDRCVGQR